MKNGLYSLHVTLGDGRTGKGSGVLTLKDGRLLGGDSYLFYRGSYEVVGDMIRGEVVVNQHTPSTSQYPLFGGKQVGIGFTGAERDGRLILDGTAFVGRESMIFHASMIFLAGFDEEA